MNVATRKHIRQATYADIPQLIELSDPIFTADGLLRDPSDIAAHFASHIGRAGCAFIAECP